tara:strand:+ start:52 stop:270 length:219 start_codon:yes stop_codon:yes gene_type:complete
VKTGDLVRARKILLPDGIIHDVTHDGVGVIIDVYYDDVTGFTYYHIAWSHEAQWWMEEELELVSESETNEGW